MENTSFQREITPNIQDKDAYISYLQDENKRLTDLVAELIKQAAEKEERQAAERKKIQAQGIQRAKREGIRFGRPPKPLPENFDSVYRLWQSGEISRCEAARRCGMPESSFRYRVKKINN